ncbi:MAG: tetratricopeptide repeat protein [Thermodesulfobacteriota bacterium]
MENGRHRTYGYWKFGLLVFFTLLIYLPSFSSGFVWDDNWYVTDNSALRTKAGLAAIWLRPGMTPQYYPLTFTTFFIERRLWGDNPAGYHAVNVTLHLLAALLLWRLLAALGMPGAWLAAALFAWHPVAVESVAWISERKNVLCAVFYFSSLQCLLAGFGAIKARHPLRLYAAGLFLFLLAMLSKTVAVSLPVVALIILWAKSRRISVYHLLAVVPFLALGLALGLLTAWLEKFHVGALGPDWSLTFPQRVLLAGRALWFYAEKLFWPDGLCFVYPKFPLDPASVTAWLYPVSAVAVLAALFFARNRIGRAPFAAAACYAVILFPALGFFNVYPFLFYWVSDHFQYLAMPALLAPAAAGAALLFSRAGDRGKIAVAALCVLALGSFSLLSYGQCRTFRNPEVLWRATLARNPKAWMAENNLGMICSGAGRNREAAEHFRAALAVNPNLTRTRLNLGVALARLGHPEQAIEQYRAALAIDPGMAEAHHNLGLELLVMGKKEEAIKELQQALAHDPDFKPARLVLEEIARQGLMKNR